MPCSASRSSAWCPWPSRSWVPDSQPATVAFIGWFGPRGLASIVFLVIALEGLHGAGEETDVLVASIGWTVLLSVVLHGLTAVPLARRYGARIAADAR